MGKNNDGSGLYVALGNTAAWTSIYRNCWKNILKREHWNAWKNEGCPLLMKPVPDTTLPISRNTENAFRNHRLAVQESPSRTSAERIPSRKEYVLACYLRDLCKPGNFIIEIGNHEIISTCFTKTAFHSPYEKKKLKYKKGKIEI